MAKIKLGLVLGGGGARGLAHVGLLKVLEAHDIKIDFIAGTSMGALVGAMYAQKPDAGWVERRIREFISSEKFKRAGRNYFRNQSDYEPQDLIQHLGREFKKRVIINLAAHRISLMKGERLTLAVTDLIENGNIEDTKIPFACSATDLRYGEAFVFKSGDIRNAITASAAIPGFIPPVKLDGRLLVDGSICDNFPVDTIREMGANFIIASNVSLELDPSTGLNNVIDIIIRANSVSTQYINKLLLEKVNYVIVPETGSFHWSEFEEFELLFRKGEEAALKEISGLLKMLKERNSLVYGLKVIIARWINKIIN